MSGALASVPIQDWACQARVVVDLDPEIVLGVTFVGPGAVELVHAATVAVAAQGPDYLSREGSSSGAGQIRRPA